MDYQYIYTVVNGNYVVLPSVRQVPPDIEKELARYAANYVGQELGVEEDFCFFSLERAKGLPVLGFGKSQRKHNCASVAQMTQCAAWDWDADLLRDHFDELLRFAFYSEAQVDAYAEGTRSVPAFGQGEAPIVGDFVDVPITKEAIRAILYGVFSRWLLGKAPIRIAVPDNEMPRYGQYVLSAVRKIYSYFPVVLRGEAGFTSRLQTKDKNFSRFSIIFVPESHADAKTLFLDGRKPAAFESIQNTTNRKSIDRFIEHLVSLDNPEERRAFLNTVYDEVERKPELSETASGSARQYANFGEALLILDNQGSTQEKIGAWLHFYKEIERFPRSAVEKIRMLIATELKPEALTDYAKQYFPGMEQVEACVSGVTSLLPLCKENATCCAALVDYLAAAAVHNNQSSEAIFWALETEKESWSQSAGQEKYMQLLAWQGKIAAEKICRTAVQAMEQSHHESLDQFQRETDRILADTQSRIDGMLLPVQKEDVIGQLARKRSAAASHSLETILDNLLARPRNTADEIRSTCAMLDKIAAEIDASPLRPELGEIREKLRVENDRLNESLRSSNVRIGELLGILNKEKSYFTALEKLASEQSNYEEKELCEGRRALNGRRPHGQDAYLKAYKSHYGRQLESTELLRMKPAMQRYVLEDLRQQSAEIIQLECAGLGPEELHTRINSICALYPGQELRFAVGKETCTSTALQRVLSLKPLSENEIDGKSLRLLCRNLADEGVFTGRHILALGEMLVCCGQKRESALVWVLKSRVRNTSNHQCLMLIEAMRQDEGGRSNKKFAELLENCLRKASEDETVEFNEQAATVCRKYIRELKKKSKTSKKLLPWQAILCVLMGALLTVGAYYIISMMKRPPVGSELESHPEENLLDQKLCAENGVLDISYMEEQERLTERVRAYFEEAEQTLAQLPESVRSDETLIEALGYPTTLIMNYDGLTELDFLSGATGLRRLVLNGNPELTELPSLELLSYLSVVDLRETRIGAEATTDFRRAHPDCFVLYSNAISYGGSVYSNGDSIWDLKDSGLETLWFLQEEGVLEILQELRVMDLSGNPLHSIDGLEQLPVLEALLLGDVEINEALCNQITQQTGLKLLYLNGCRLSVETEAQLNRMATNGLLVSMEHNTYIEKAETVHICGADYDISQKMLDLSGLGLTSEALSELELWRFTQLRVLDLSNNELTDLSALSGLYTLQRLNISDNQIVDLTPLAQLSALTELYADNNPVDTIEVGSYDFSALKILSLDGELLQSYEGLARLQSLQVLLLSNSGAAKGDALAALQSLRVLRLDGSLSEEALTLLHEREILLLDVEPEEEALEANLSEEEIDGETDGEEAAERQEKSADMQENETISTAIPNTETPGNGQRLPLR